MVSDRSPISSYRTAKDQEVHKQAQEVLPVEARRRQLEAVSRDSTGRSLPMPKKQRSKRLSTFSILMAAALLT